MMTLSAIVALDENNAIGRDNQLPWHLPEDLKFFKRTTFGKPVLMGRKTYDSLGKPLPGRLNIVVSGQKDLSLPEGVLLYNDLNAAIERLKEEEVEEGFIIGGGKIFAETLPITDRLSIRTGSLYLKIHALRMRSMLMPIPFSNGTGLTRFDNGLACFYTIPEIQREGHEPSWCAFSFRICLYRRRADAR